MSTEATQQRLERRIKGLREEVTDFSEIQEQISQAVAPLEERIVTLEESNKKLTLDIAFLLAQEELRRGKSHGQ